MKLHSLAKPLVLFILSFYLTGCSLTWWAQSIPAVDIVYQAGKDEPQLGFVNADGSNNSFINLIKDVGVPIWSLDGHALFGLENIYQDYAFEWTPGERPKRCKDWFGLHTIQHLNDENSVYKALVVSSQKIFIGDLRRCKVEEILVDTRDIGELFVYGASYSHTVKTLIYGLGKYAKDRPTEYKIIKLDIPSKMKTIITNGVNPTWSHDGRWIAYVGEDGIYIIRPDGSGSRNVVNHTFVDPRTKDYGVVTPIPRWSPDDQWIIFHQCEKYDCIDYENSIYKVEVETGKIEKIIDGGAFPDWRQVDDK
jgi:hypothetical protein